MNVKRKKRGGWGTYAVCSDLGDGFESHVLMIAILHGFPVKVDQGVQDGEERAHDWWRDCHRSCVRHTWQQGLSSPCLLLLFFLLCLLPLLLGPRSQPQWHLWGCCCCCCCCSSWCRGGFVWLVAGRRLMLAVEKPDAREMRNVRRARWTDAWTPKQTQTHTHNLNTHFLTIRAQGFEFEVSRYFIKYSDALS